MAEELFEHFVLSPDKREYSLKTEALCSQCWRNAEKAQPAGLVTEEYAKSVGKPGAYTTLWSSDPSNNVSRYRMQCERCGRGWWDQGERL